jgi:hypothetical protein
MPNAIVSALSQSSSIRRSAEQRVNIIDISLNGNPRRNEPAHGTDHPTGVPLSRISAPSAVRLIAAYGFKAAPETPSASYPCAS